MKILISAYRCSPFDVSEAYSSFAWVEILIKEHKVTLLTTKQNEQDILNYFSERTDNLEIFSFYDDYYLKKSKFIHKEIKLGYFLFNSKVEKFIDRQPDFINKYDFLFHRSPQSFRYYSCLSKYNKPFIIGPLEGGLKPPGSFKNYFSKEPKLFKLRNLDDFILSRKKYRNQFENAYKVLISLDYVRQSLEYVDKDKMIQIFNTGIHLGAPDNVFKKVSQPKSLLYIGSLTRYKGAEFLIRAFGKLDPQHRNGTIVDIVGSGEEEKHLKSMVAQLGIETEVKFHGQVPRKSVEQYYRNASIFCFPTFKEAAGNVFLEAMSFSLPIITLNTGGPKYICPDEGAIKLEPTNETNLAQEMSDAIKRLLDNPNLCSKMGSYNRQYCDNNYSWSAMEGNILKLFDDIESDLA